MKTNPLPWLVAAPVVLTLLAGCTTSGPVSTNPDPRGREIEERHAELDSQRAQVYRRVRDQIPERDLQVHDQVKLTPSEIAGLFAIAYLASKAPPQLALYEAERVQEDEVPREYRPLVFLVRGYIYIRLGWHHLARAEIEKATPEDTTPYAKEIRKLIHYALVFNHLHAYEFGEAAKEVEANEDSFRGDALGEVLIALASARDGDLNKAADALERAKTGRPFDEETRAQVTVLVERLRTNGDWRATLGDFVVARARQNEAFNNEQVRARYAETMEKVSSTSTEVKNRYEQAVSALPR
jgi:hypothetical protein